MLVSHITRHLNIKRYGDKLYILQLGSVFLSSVVEFKDLTPSLGLKPRQHLSSTRLCQTCALTLLLRFCDPGSLSVGTAHEYVPVALECRLKNSKQCTELGLDLATVVGETPCGHEANAGP